MIDDIDIDAALATRHQIATIWSIQDVQKLRPDLSEDQCWEVLQSVRHDHDARIGINWEILSCHADMIFGDALKVATPTAED